MQLQKIMFKIKNKKILYSIDPFVPQKKNKVYVCDRDSQPALRKDDLITKRKR